MEENGVWRTVGGRRIFIKEGQDLASAMKESGKFNSNAKKKRKELSNEEKAEKSVLIKQQREKLRERLKKRETPKNTISKNDEETAKKYRQKNDKLLRKELEEGLDGIEQEEDKYGIDDTTLDEIKTDTYKKMEELYDDGEISDYVWEDFIDSYNNKIYDIMSEKGYEGYMHEGKYYYSMLPKAKRSYDEILNELDKRGLDYKVSRSWNPGELPSIYVEDKNGNTFRIANHYNSKNQEFSEGSWERNKIYSTKDYINYKNTVFKDIEKWLKDNED